MQTVSCMQISPLLRINYVALALPKNTSPSPPPPSLQSSSPTLSDNTSFVWLTIFSGGRATGASIGSELSIPGIGGS